jgi:hypothetical protein
MRDKYDWMEGEKEKTEGKEREKEREIERNEFCSQLLQELCVKIQIWPSTRNRMTK